MKCLSFVAVLGSLSLVPAPAPLRADGFSFSEHGGCASGLAGAFIARACTNDPSSLFYNPAAVTLVSGTRLSIGGTAILNASEYRFLSPIGGATTVLDENETFFPVHAFLSHQINDRLAVGLAFFIPYGLGTEWGTPQANVGRFVGYNTEILAHYTQPTVAYRLSPQIAVGAGLEIAYTTAELNRLVDLRDIEGTESLDPTTYPPLTYSAADAHLSANGWSLGFVASVLIE
ncbi:MAG: OmpP1/FadL family transporter, partial [Gemmatimonadota bacterium]